MVAGSPHEPLTRSIASDLERRGFIVYITVLSEEEEQIVRSENRLDILPLWLDLTTVRFWSLKQAGWMHRLMDIYRHCHRRQKYIRHSMRSGP